jgi:hypothetical protein
VLLLFLLLYNSFHYICIHHSSDTPPLGATYRSPFAYLASAINRPRSKLASSRSPGADASNRIRNPSPPSSAASLVVHIGFTPFVSTASNLFTNLKIPSTSFNIASSPVRVDTLANRATERSSFASMIDPASPPPLDVDPPSPAVSAVVDHDARVGMPSVVDPCALHRPSGSKVVVVVKLLSRTLTVVAFMTGIVVIIPPRVPPIDDDDDKEDETIITLLNRIAIVAIVIAVARRPSNGARSPVQFQKK